MSWYRFIDFLTPLVFSPKVTPDPIVAKQLNEKFEEVIRRLKQPAQQVRLHASGPSGEVDRHP